MPRPFPMPTTGPGTSPSDLWAESEGKKPLRCFKHPSPTIPRGFVSPPCAPFETSAAESEGKRSFLCSIAHFVIPTPRSEFMPLGDWGGSFSQKTPPPHHWRGRSRHGGHEMLRFIGLCVILSLFFAAGFYLGRGGRFSIPKELSDLKEEMSFKGESLHDEIASTRVRMTLLEAKDHLLQADMELDNRNFGEAEREIALAEQKMTKATELAKSAQKKPLLDRLMPIAVSLKETRNDVHRMDPKAKTKLAGLEKAIDRMID